MAPKKSVVPSTAIKKKKKARSPVPLQSSPVGTSVNDLLEDAIESVQKQTKVAHAQRQSSLFNLTVTDPRAGWENIENARLQREQIETYENLEVEISEGLDLIEQENDYKSRHYDIIQGVERTIGNPDVDASRQLRTLVVDLIEQIPYAETDWLRRKYKSEEAEEYIDNLIGKYRILLKNSQHNVEAFNTILSRLKKAMGTIQTLERQRNEDEKICGGKLQIAQDKIDELEEVLDDLKVSYNEVLDEVEELKQGETDLAEDQARELNQRIQDLKDQNSALRKDRTRLEGELKLAQQEPRDEQGRTFSMLHADFKTLDDRLRTADPRPIFANRRAEGTDYPYGRKGEILFPENVTSTSSSPVWDFATDIGFRIGRLSRLSVNDLETQLMYGYKRIEQYREEIEDANKKCEDLEETITNRETALKICHEEGQGKDAILDRWKEVLLTFILDRPKLAWMSCAREIGEFAEIFVKYDEIRAITFVRDGKLEKWWQIASVEQDPLDKDPKVLLLQIWYQLVHPHLAPEYNDVLALVYNMQGLSEGDIDFAAACLEHGLAAQSRMTNPSPAQWSASQCTAWLRLVDLLCTFYNGHVVRLQSLDMTIDMSNGRKSVFVDGLFKYVSAKLSSPVPGRSWLGRYIAEHARANNTGIRKGRYDLIPDGNDMIVVGNASESESTVFVFTPKHFALERVLKGWILILNHLNVHGKAVKIGLSCLDKRDEALVEDLMTHALLRKDGGNIGFQRLPFEEL